MNKFFVCLTASLLLGAGALWSNPAETSIGVVNFATCATESKIGKQEHEKLEASRNQWVSLIQQSKKELDGIAEKLENKEYLEGISPEAEENLKLKYKSLNEDLMKYQNQLSQELYQAQAISYQKILEQASLAAETIATKNKIKAVVIKDICLFFDKTMDLTSEVLAEMDKNFDKMKKDTALNDTSKAPLPAPAKEATATAKKADEKKAANAIAKKESDAKPLAPKGTKK